MTSNVWSKTRLWRVTQLDETRLGAINNLAGHWRTVELGGRLAKTLRAGGLKAAGRALRNDRNEMAVGMGGKPVMGMCGGKWCVCEDASVMH